MAIKKISELNTKSFLGNPSAAANSYVLINYEDSTTNAPVTYKASLQELGKAIATELKLPTVTVSQGVPNLKVKTASNGAYVDSTINGLVNEEIKSFSIPEVQGNARLVYFVASSLTEPYLITDSERQILVINDIANKGYVDTAISTGIYPLASKDDVNTAISGLASEGYVNTAVYGLASEGYVTNAINAQGGYAGNDSPIIATGNSEHILFSVKDSNQETLGTLIFPVDSSNTSDVLVLSSEGQIQYTETNDNVTRLVNGPKILGFEINNNDLILKDYQNNTLCTLSNVINNQ